ncbi:MAG: DNA adenine methylase [Candidatus Melainabacteria bacterium]|nr:DNA adenine methylase [Candidatus Melainabacteria bacterium]
MKDGFLKYKARDHAAVRTQEYLFNQLFPYIGNKRKLLPLIFEAILQTGVENGLLVDFFSGSGVVSRLAKKLGFQVISNDWEPYSFFYNNAYIEQNKYPDFKKLDGMEKVYEYLNNLEGVHGYIGEYYCPWDDKNPDIKKERMFFTHKNGMKIDVMREKINEWEKEEKINLKEKSILLASFLYSVSYVSNTSGVFKGFHNGWGGKTGTALYRILSDIKLVPPVLCDNEQENKVYQIDSQILAENLSNLRKEKINIVYLDPPYNQHPYGSNYHILNTIALWDKPEINKSILVNEKKTNKSAIRTDWKTERRSAYNYKGEATKALDKLIQTINSDYVLLSYSTDGHMDLKDVLEIMAASGKLSMVTKSYKRYRVSTPRMSKKPYNIEAVLILDKNKTSPEGVAKKLWNEFVEQDKWLKRGT